MKTLHCADEAATRRLGVVLGRVLRAGDLIALYGELGAGKTTLTRGIAEGLGIDPGRVSSPTFVLMHEYAAPVGLSGGCCGGLTLVHIDAYRMGSAEELDGLGWGEELFEQAAVVVEWPQRVAEALPADRLAAYLEHAETGRAVGLVGHGSWSTRVDDIVWHP